MSLVVTVVGATGHVGAPIVEALLARHIAVRAVARGAERLAPLGAAGADVRTGQLQDTAWLTGVLRGSDVAFVMLPPNVAAADQRSYRREVATSLAGALAASGVPRAVAMSSIGADIPSGTGPIAGLHEMEHRLAAVPGLAVVTLRPGFFMENLLAAVPIIKAGGVHSSSMRGDVPIPMVATRDIAMIATELLAQPLFARSSVRPLIGPQDYTLAQATSILGAAIGRPDLPYVEVSEADVRAALVRAGVADGAADDLVELNAALSDGQIQRSERRDAAILTPTTLDQFARDVFARAYAAG